MSNIRTESPKSSWPAAVADSLTFATALDCTASDLLWFAEALRRGELPELQSKGELPTLEELACG